MKESIQSSASGSGTLESGNLTMIVGRMGKWRVMEVRTNGLFILVGMILTG